MKKLVKAFLVCFIFLLSSHAYTQNAVMRPDTVWFHHKCYTSIFDTVKHIPVLVFYTLKKNMYRGKTSKGKGYKREFSDRSPKDDPTNLYSDYKWENSCPYEHGHCMSARACGLDSTGKNESYYYSNIMPQTSQLNSHAWKQLENQEEKLTEAYDSIRVIVGSYGQAAKIGFHKIIAPEYWWKVIIIKDCCHDVYRFPNDFKVCGKLKDYKIDLNELKKHISINIEEWTKFKLPDPCRTK